MQVKFAIILYQMLVKSPSIPLFQSGKTMAKVTSFDFSFSLGEKEKEKASLFFSSVLSPTLKKGG